MRLGIDFGTTRVVAAAADRGNYPVVCFESADGAVRDWIPPLIATGEDGRRLYGWAAWHALGAGGATVIRSIKRVLGDAGPATLIDLGPIALPLSQILGELAAHIRQELQTYTGAEPVEILLGVPANANSNQRFLTLEAFHAAGFDVLGLLNEPSAASIEYAHRLQDLDTAPPELILVYDLGGGTFDASLVSHTDGGYTVTATESIATLGGDDFDELLASLALAHAGLAESRHALTQAEEFLLLEECREKKEALHPNTRRILIDLDRVRAGWPQTAVPVAEFYEHCQPLVDETLDVTDSLLATLPESAQIALYVTGGASELPLIGRLLRERFGRRVKRSAYTRAATAIGLAIQAAGHSSYQLRERFTRHFGVWREAEGGRLMIFDPLFERGMQLPAPDKPPLTRTRTYSPVHNIGHFRYLECSHRGDAGEPTGDVSAWDEIRFPFDPALAAVEDLSATPVTHSDAAAGQLIEERYTADSSGAVRVTISNRTAGYQRVYRLARWAADETAQPMRPRRTARHRSAKRS
ncbi:MAG: Hsp70 family protein [Bryobacterales bacterium]|nr:Hsp70 family protein [Bryobacterales bacterium]